MSEREEKLRELITKWRKREAPDYISSLIEAARTQYADELEALLAEPQPVTCTCTGSELDFSCGVHHGNRAGPIVTVTHGALPGCTADAIAQSGKWQTFEQPALPRLGAQKHLETCCACNHGRTPCEEYRRNYENSSAVAGMEHPNGKISSVGDGLGIKQTASQPAPPSLSAANSTLADQISILRTTCDAHIHTIEDMQAEIDELKQREAEIRDRVLEEAAQLCEAQVEAILCGDVYDINDDPDTPKLTAAINAALKSQVSVAGASHDK